MPTRSLLPSVLTFLALVSLALLAACGSGGSSTQVPPSTPVFTSVPVTAATQDVAYTYQLAATDPAGGSVTFTLTTSPTGAALTGNTIAWTPTAAESRVSNGFAVKATTASGGTASQSWTVTPGGTITVSWVNTYWTETGAVPVPEPPNEALSISALVTNPDGSITVEKSSATAPGVFSIPNVPGGYYWMNLPGGAYWTSTSTFHADRDFAGVQEPPLAPTSQNTWFDLNLSGLESVAETSWVELSFPIPSGPWGVVSVSANSTILTGIGFGFGGDIDWSKIDSAFLRQYVPTPLGSLNNSVLGSALAPTGLTFIDGATNTLTETLQPNPQTSFDVNILGASQWSGLFTNGAAPAATTAYSSALSVSAQPYVSGINAGGLSVTLAATAPLPGGQPISPVAPITCDAPGFSVNPSPAQAAIVTDQDFGTLQYADPFDSSWTRALHFCQEYTVPIPVGSSATANFALVDSTTVPVSSSVPPSLAPLVSQVLAPTINGASLFTAATLNTTVVPLSWSAPATGAPYGYRVVAFVQTTSPTGTATYSSAGVFYTAKTSITLPPLAGGNTYVFAIVALADGTAQVETGPFRSSLPTGYATVVSGPVTISSSAQMPAIHGDRRVITRLSQAQPVAKEQGMDRF